MQVQEKDEERGNREPEPGPFPFPKTVAGLEEARGNNHGAVRCLLGGARDLHYKVGAAPYPDTNRGSWDVTRRDVRYCDRLPPVPAV